MPAQADLALILALDCSASVTYEEFGLMASGCAAGLRHEAVVAGLLGGPGGASLCAVLIWSGVGAQDLVLDTPKVNVTGTGNINFIDESLHLRLVSRSKGFSLASLRGPVVITGTFKNSAVRPELGGVIVRGGLAAALGAATAGIGALLPLLDFGKNKDSNCAALISQAKSDAGVKASDILPKPLAKKLPPTSTKSVKPKAAETSASPKTSRPLPTP